MKTSTTKSRPSRQSRRLPVSISGVTGAAIFAMSEFKNKYRDPRWQKRRLEIMQKDGFNCIICKTASETLNVHHRYYVAGRDPWVYPDWALITLCEACHKEQHDKDRYRDTPFEQWEHAVGAVDDRDFHLEPLWQACVESRAMTNTQELTEGGSRNG